MLRPELKFGEVDNKERLKGLFLSLTEEKGYGKGYQGTIAHYPWEFDVRRLRIGLKLFRIAIREEDHLTTVVIFAKANHWWHRAHQWWNRNVFNRNKNLDPIALTIYGGKLCPPVQHYHYPDVLQVKRNLPPTSKFFRRFPMEDLLAGLGMASPAEDMAQYVAGELSHFKICFTTNVGGKIILPDATACF